MNFLSLAALEVVILTTAGAASDENFIKMTFLFQCIKSKSKIFFLFFFSKSKIFYYNKIIIIHRMTQRLKPIWIYLSHKFLPLFTLQRPHFDDNSVSITPEKPSKTKPHPYFLGHTVWKWLYPCIDSYVITVMEMSF